MYWRIQSFVEEAYKSGVANFQNPLWYKDLRNAIQPWQEKITNGPKYDPGFIRQFVPYIESGAQQADAIVMQYPQEEGALELFDSLKHNFPHTPILTEIDDNILSVPVYNMAFSTYDPMSEVRARAVRQMKASDGIIASTPHLKEIYSEFNPNIWVIQNSIDFRRWDSLKKKSKAGIRIGWAGGCAHEGDFEPLAPAIHRVAEKYKDARFCFINGPAAKGLPDFLADVPRVEHKAIWKPVMKYPQMLAEQGYTIGIAPIRDSDFNRGKSNLKWLENSAMGIPTVAANVGHMAETVRDGVDGLLYNNAQEFEAKLSSLISDRKLRARIGAAAYARVKADFNLKSTVSDYVDVLQEAIDRKAVEPPKQDGWASAVVDLPVPKQVVHLGETETRISIQETI